MRRRTLAETEPPDIENIYVDTPHFRVGAIAFLLLLLMGCAAMK